MITDDGTDMLPPPVIGAGTLLLTADGSTVSLPGMDVGLPLLTTDDTGIVPPNVIGAGTPLLTADGSTDIVLPPVMTPLWTADGSTDTVPPVMDVKLPFMTTDDGTDIISLPFMDVERGIDLEEELGAANTEPVSGGACTGTLVPGELTGDS